MKMNCEKADELISRYLDGEISASEQEALRQHLSKCEACRERERQYRLISEALPSAGAPAPPEGYSQRLSQAVQDRLAQGQRPHGSPAYRVASLAAMIALAAGVTVLAWLLNQERAENVGLTARLQTQKRQVSVATPFAAVFAHHAPDWNDAAEEFKAFQVVQDYLNGGLRWMAMDGDQVEGGMSGSSAKPREVSGKPRRVIVLDFQYVERFRNGATHRLSSPRFILLPGGEAVVRFKRSDKRADESFRYEVTADIEKDGRVRASVSFSSDGGGKDDSIPVLDSTVTGSVRLAEKVPVLLGATGNALRRRELLLWGGTMEMPQPTGEPGAVEARSL